MSEGVLECSLAELVDRARALAVQGERHIIGLTGAPGAGKSTVAGQLVEELGPGLAVLVSMDGFHLANSVLEQLGRRDRKGAPDTFDDAGYVNLLQRLNRSSLAGPTSNEIVYAPRFDRDLEESIGSAIPVPPAIPLVVTEGNYLLLDSGSWSRARSFLDEVWFLDPGDDVRKQWLVQRHERYGKSLEAAKAWALGTDQNNAEIIDSTRDRASLIVRIV